MKSSNKNLTRDIVSLLSIFLLVIWIAANVPSAAIAPRGWERCGGNMYRIRASGGWHYSTAPGIYSTFVPDSAFAPEGYPAIPH